MRGIRLGQRLEYYRTTLAIIADHPVLGVGTGAFAQAYAEKIRGTHGHATVNPHNDYLLIAAQVGLPALIVLLALYALIWHYAAGLATPLERDLARGLVIAIAVGGVFNSLLLDHTEGLLFAWLTAVLYAGYNRPHSPAEAHA
jgi:O-antigen ligase